MQRLRSEARQQPAHDWTLAERLRKFTRRHGLAMHFATECALDLSWDAERCTRETLLLQFRVRPGNQSVDSSFILESADVVPIDFVEEIRPELRLQLAIVADGVRDKASRTAFVTSIVGGSPICVVKPFAVTKTGPNMDPRNVDFASRRLWKEKFFASVNSGHAITRLP